MKDVIKGKRNKLVAAQINDNYKLVIPEHHIFFSLKPFYDALGIKATVALEKKENNKNFKPQAKKIALYCEELDQFQNQINSQSSMRLFSVDVDNNNIVHYKPPHMYLLLSFSSFLHSLHLTLLEDKNYNIIN